MQIVTPYINSTKTEIVQFGLQLNIDFSNKISCYFPTYNISCGKCLSCTIRLIVFKENKIEDKIKYFKNCQ